MREMFARMMAVATLILVLAAVGLFAWRQQAGIEVLQAAVDPLVWAARYPQHHAALMRTADNYGRTAHGGSEAYDKLAANPFRRRAFAGNAFALEYRAARGHFHAQRDQQGSRRTAEQAQPGGCINCHAAEAPGLIESLGWEVLHALDYDDLREHVHFGTSCADCHEPATMALTLTRPALVNALQAQGIDPAGLSRGELRSYVCAQCHVEYYFRGEGRILTYPWPGGRRLEDIETYYEALGHVDWVHAESGAGLLKMQHPEMELFGTGVHAAQGLACADCHMPTIQVDGRRISDHWLRSPLLQLGEACLDCHRSETAESLRSHVVSIQDATVVLLGLAEQEIDALIDAIVAARADGAGDEALVAARLAHRRAQLRWDFIDAENSTGFHAAAEARRILTDAAALARQGRASLSVP